MSAKRKYDEITRLTTLYAVKDQTSNVIAWFSGLQKAAQFVMELGSPENWVICLIPMATDQVSNLSIVQ
jgi:hypothetical protein